MIVSFAIAQGTNVSIVYIFDSYRPIAGETVVTQLAFKCKSPEKLILTSIINLTNVISLLWILALILHKPLDQAPRLRRRFWNDGWDLRSSFDHVDSFVLLGPQNSTCHHEVDCHSEFDPVGPGQRSRRISQKIGNGV